MQNSKTCDVAIVGAGLVGATLAALLAQAPDNQHLSIVLIDQGDAPTLPDLSAHPPRFDPRVVALAQVSVNLFQSLDIWSQVLDQRACPYRHMTVWDHEGTGQIEFDASELRQPALGVIVENSLLLGALLDKIVQFPRIRMMRRQAITDMVDESFHGEHRDDTSINTGPQANDGGPQKKITLSSGETLSARLVVAADGAHSKVRELMNMPTRSWSYQHQAIVTTVQCEHRHQWTAWQNFLASGPLALLPLGDRSQQFCSIVWSVENQRAGELMQLADEPFRQALGNAFEHRLGAVLRVDRRHCFPLVQRHAVDYFLPRIALVGDAAHTIHPLAGQGVNLGLLDAHALAREITRASKRQLSLADASILRRYQRQRKRHNLEMMALMEAFKRLFGSRLPAIRWLRNSGLKTVNRTPVVKNWLVRQAMGL